MSESAPVTAEVWKQSAIVDRFLSFNVAIPLAGEQISVLLTLLASHPEPVKNFLDLGCGDGILGAALLDKYLKSQGILADFSEPMLEKGREQLKDYASQLQFVNLDYADPTWVDAMQSSAPFDAIVSRYSIHHQPDERKRAIYVGIFELLEPGGWFVNIEHILPSAQLTTDLLDKHIIDGRYAIEVKNGGTKTRQEISDIFMNRLDRETNLLTPIETQCNWLREIGYEEVDCYFRIYELAVFGGRRPLETMPKS